MGDLVLLLLIGAAILIIIRQVIDWKIPVFYIGTTFYNVGI